MSELGDKERRFVEDQRRVIESRTIQSSSATYFMRKSIAQQKELDHKDALLAEAAEVLRAIDVVMMDQKSYPSILKAYGAIEEILVKRAKPLLDKLGERE